MRALEFTLAGETAMPTNVVEKTIDDCGDVVVKLENPLRVAFPSPKSERNLKSSTIFREASSQIDDKLGHDERREVSSQSLYAFPISQILG